MAKTAKAKAKKKAASAKRTTSGKKELRVPMHSVVHFVRMLQDEKHSAKFVNAARGAKALVTLHPNTLRFVRKYLADNKLHEPMATKVVDPCPGDPFECHFRD